METSSEEEDFYTSSSESIASAAGDSIWISVETSTNEAVVMEAENMDILILDDAQQAPLDLSIHPLEFPDESLTNLASARAGSNSADELATTQSQSGAKSSYVQYLVNKFSNYSRVTMNYVEFEINKVLFKADMGTYDNTG